jgi:hypothetical protein
VQETIAAGAKCLLGGEMPEDDGFFYPVTLLTEVELANDTPYGGCQHLDGDLAWTNPGEAIRSRSGSG